MAGVITASATKRRILSQAWGPGFHAFFVPIPSIPPGVRGGAVSLQAGGQRRVGLNRLLIEVRPDTAARVETITADGTEVAALGGLHFGQPAQGL